MTTPAAELSVRAVVLGAALSVLLSAANAYLGLFAGMTVSASIPAAVISMGMLRAVRGTLLENNIVQTAASAGESAAAGAIFTLPALVLLGATSHLDYLASTVLVGTGGVLGVLFTIPLRRALVLEGDLPFPEGVATAEVLRAGHAQAAGSSGLRVLGVGAGFGALAKLASSGLHVAAETLEGAFWLRGSAVYGGLSLSPALAAVGAIVGIRIAWLMVLGGAVNWLVAVPLVTEDSVSSALEAAGAAWSSKTRYLGVGAMCVGGLWTLIDVRGALVSAVRTGGQALRQGDVQEDLSRPILRSLLGGSAAVAGVALFSIAHSWLLALLLLALVLVFGFLFCAVAAYMAGLVGSSNNPVSGVTIATILLTSFVLLALGFSDEPSVRATGSASAILVGTMVCTAAAIGGDNMQDLKAGALLGAKPWRQQVAQLVGVVCAALVLAPVLNLLERSYGFGSPTELHPHALRAPQATLMAAVAQGVFGGSLPWRFVALGAAIAFLTILLDQGLRRSSRSFRVPVLALAVGIYLPVSLTVTMALGALAAQLGRGRGEGRLLTSAGLITGEALMGIALAAGVVIFDGLPLSLARGPFVQALLGCGVLGVTLWLLAGRRAT